MFSAVKALFIIIATGLVSLIAAAAQSPGTAVPGQVTRTPSGAAAAVIRGRILAAIDGAPLRGAHVQYRRIDERAARNVVSDTQGYFQIEALSAGSYEITATMVGFVSLAYGQRRPLEAARPVEVKAGEVFEGVTIALPKASVVATTVRDMFGNPVMGYRVRAEQVTYAGGTRRLKTAQLVETDDEGYARLYGLLPGDYYISAGPTPISPRAADMNRIYVATYYPNVTTPSDAKPVRVRVGEEVLLDLTMIPAPVASISGSLRSSNGGVPTGIVAVLISAAGTSTALQVQPDGSFLARNIPSGQYSIEVGPNAANLGTLDEYASVPVMVAGDSLSGVSVTTGRGSRVHGRFTFDRPTTFGFTKERISVVPKLLPDRASSVGRFSVAEDGSFEMSAILGAGFLRLGSVPEGLFLDAILWDGREITDEVVDFKINEDFSGVEVRLTKDQSLVDGVITDRAGALTSDCTVVVFSEDRSKWGASDRFVAAARPNQSGQFNIKGLPAGRYLAAVVDYLEAGSEHDPEVLEKLSQANATHLTIGRGQKMSLNLRLP